MLKNYFKIAFRNLLRNKTHSTINVLGLAVGMACAILLYLYVKDELSYDQYHKNKSQVYRIEADHLEDDGSLYKTAQIGPAISTTLQNDYPEVEIAARVWNLGRKVLKLNDRKFYENDIYLADSSIFDVLSFRPIAGNVHRALTQPRAMVLTHSLANKLFRSPRLALGKSLILDDSISYTVASIIEDVPSNSHFKPHALVSMSSFPKAFFKHYNNLSVSAYVKLKKGTLPQTAEASLRDIYRKHIREDRKEERERVKMYLKPITSIHLSSKTENDYADVADVNTIYVFAAIGILILLVACANYVNLATARSTKRAKEVGIRKVVGSHRKQLVFQFLGESMLLSVFAFIVCLSLVELTLPMFNQLTGKELSLNYTTQPQILLVLLGIALFMGLVAGSYPAYVLSGFRPHQVLKGRFSNSKQGNTLRKGLVVFQFSISITMIIGTWIVHHQLQFVKNKKLGFDKYHTLNLSFVNEEESRKYPILKRQLLQHPNIKVVAGASFGMNNDLWLSTLTVEREDGTKKVSLTPIGNYFVGADYISALGMHLKQGRNFDAKITSDYEKAVIVNEAFVKKFGWKNAIGKEIDFSGKKIGLNKYGFPYKTKVVGVVADFHTESLYKPIEPIMMRFVPTNMGELRHVFVKLKAKDIKKTLAFVQDTWEKLHPKHPYQGEFLDQRFANAYRADQKRGRVFLIFSVLAIFVACLGLFGLASFEAYQRAREIAIRRILGASFSQILILLSSSFVKLILASNLMAFPLAYYFANDWLQNFAYKITMHWSMFLLASIVSLAIALLAISFQSFGAAKINPVRTLQDE